MIRLSDFDNSLSGGNASAIVSDGEVSRTVIPASANATIGSLPVTSTRVSSASTLVRMTAPLPSTSLSCSSSALKRDPMSTHLPLPVGTSVGVFTAHPVTWR